MDLTSFYTQPWEIKKVAKLKTELEKAVFTHPKMIEMKENLDEFYKELSLSILQKTSLPFGSFKRHFYPNLEKLLIEIMTYSNKETEEEKIGKAYAWYQGRMEVFNKLKNIDYNTFVDNDQLILQKETLKEKSKYYEAQNYIPEFQNEFRTNPNCSIKDKYYTFIKFTKTETSRKTFHQ